MRDTDLMMGSLRVLSVSVKISKREYLLGMSWLGKGRITRGTHHGSCMGVDFTLSLRPH